MSVKPDVAPPPPPRAPSPLAPREREGGGGGRDHRYFYKKKVANIKQTEDCSHAARLGTSVIRPMKVKLSYVQSSRERISSPYWYPSWDPPKSKRSKHEMPEKAKWRSAHVLTMPSYVRTGAYLAHLNASAPSCLKRHSHPLLSTPLLQDFCHKAN